VKKQKSFQKEISVSSERAMDGNQEFSRRMRQGEKQQVQPRKGLGRRKKFQGGEERKNKKRIIVKRGKDPQRA